MLSCNTGFCVAAPPESKNVADRVVLNGILLMGEGTGNRLIKAFSQPSL
jgi:hypothetical protein